MRRPISRDQKTTIVYGILCFVVLVVVLQLWLLTATMNAWLGGDRTILVPGAVVSIVAFLLNCGLLRYVYVMERRGR
ncbi:MAG: hypothetical protein NDJ92_12810 [Thermoanaerobaculia bacterium]|nr:hypothetical protein [Thermoanaerobaculia bacterium]